MNYKSLLRILAVLSLIACQKPSDTPTLENVFFVDPFDDAAAYSFQDTSTTVGMQTGSGTGSISGGKLLLTGQGAIVIPGPGPCGAYEAQLLNPPTLGDGVSYTIRITFTGIPQGSAPSGNYMVVNGTIYSLISNTQTTSEFDFTAPSPATTLDLKFNTHSCDDMGMVLSSSLEVIEIKFIQK